MSTTFTAKTVTEVTGVQHGALKMWHLRGLLKTGAASSADGKRIWRRYSFEDLVSVAIMRELSRFLGLRHAGEAIQVINDNRQYFRAPTCFLVAQISGGIMGKYSPDSPSWALFNSEDMLRSTIAPRGVSVEEGRPLVSVVLSVHEIAADLKRKLAGLPCTK